VKLLTPKKVLKVKRKNRFFFFFCLFTFSFLVLPHATEQFQLQNYIRFTPANQPFSHKKTGNISIKKKVFRQKIEAG